MHKLRFLGGLSYQLFKTSNYNDLQFSLNKIKTCIPQTAKDYSQICVRELWCLIIPAIKIMKRTA